MTSKLIIQPNHLHRKIPTRSNEKANYADLSSKSEHQFLEKGDQIVLESEMAAKAEHGNSEDGGGTSRAPFPFLGDSLMSALNTSFNPYGEASMKNFMLAAAKDETPRYIRPSRDVLKAQLHMLLMRSPIDIEKLIHMAEIDKYNPSYYYLGFEYEKIGNLEKALYWYSKSNSPNAFLRTAKIEMQNWKCRYDEDFPRNDDPVLQKNEEKVIDLLRRAASKGLGEAYYSLGILHMHRDWRKSLLYFRDAMKLGYTEAVVGLWKEDDPMVKQRLRVDVLESTQISEQEKLLLLGYAYQYGYGMKQDFEEALKLFDQVSTYIPPNRRYPQKRSSSIIKSQNSLESSNYLIHHNEMTAGSSSSFNKSQNNISNISSQASSQANSIRTIYIRLQNVKDILARYRSEKQVRLEAKEKQKIRSVGRRTTQTAEITLPDPEIKEVYDRIKKHICVSWKEEMKEAEGILRELVAEGYIDGICIAADFYSHGYPGIAIDMKFSNRLYKCAASVGHLAGMLRHANNLLFDYEWTNNKSHLEEAISYYRKAAEKNVTPAMCNLANLYEKGLVSGKIDYKRAAALYKKALLLGDPAGANGLAELYYHGYGVPKNYMKTVKYLFEAIDSGDKDAEENMQLLCLEPEGVEAMVLALEAFRELSAEGNKEAHNLALRLQQELGYKQNWDSQDLVLRTYQKNMSQLHFENMGEMTEEDGYIYFTVTCDGKYYQLKAIRLPTEERVDSNLLWSTLKRELVPHIQVRDVNLHAALYWAADIDYIYIMREKIIINFRYILERTKWNYTHELKSSALSNDRAVENFLTHDQETPSKTSENLANIYDTDQKLEDLIVIAKAIKKYHDISRNSHQSITSKHILLSLPTHVERMYKSRSFSRLYNTSEEHSGTILISNHAMKETNSLLNFELSSYAWCAPEVIRDGKYSAASDAYAFGMILYEFLTHLIPYGDISNKYTVQNKSLRGEFPSIPAEIRNFKGSNYFVSHIIDLMKECWTDTRSRVTFEEIIHHLEVLKKRIRVHRTRVSLSKIFQYLGIEQYLDHFAQEEISIKKLLCMEQAEILELFQNAEIPANRLLGWINLEKENTSPETYAKRMILLRELAELPNNINVSSFAVNNFEVTGDNGHLTR